MSNFTVQLPVQFDARARRSDFRNRPRISTQIRIPTFGMTGRTRTASGHRLDIRCICFLRRRKILTARQNFFFARIFSGRRCAWHGSRQRIIQIRIWRERRQERRGGSPQTVQVHPAQGPAARRTMPLHIPTAARQHQHIPTGARTEFGANQVHRMQSLQRRRQIIRRQIDTRRLASHVKNQIFQTRITNRPKTALQTVLNNQLHHRPLRGRQNRPPQIIHHKTKRTDRGAILHRRRHITPRNQRCIRR